MSLTDELRKSPPARQRGYGRQAFLARREEIQQAVDEGFSSAEVWQHLHDKGLMPIQYRQFARYVDKYINKEAKEEERKVSVDKKPEPVKDKDAKSTEVKRTDGEPKQLKTDLVKRFEHNPSAKPDEELF